MKTKAFLLSTFLAAHAGGAMAQDAQESIEPRAATPEELAQCSDEIFWNLEVLSVDPSSPKPFQTMSCVSKTVSQFDCRDLSALLYDIPNFFRQMQNGELSRIQTLKQNSIDDALLPTWREYCDADADDKGNFAIHLGF